MRALTLHQPYAQLVADGRKPFETRKWHPPQSAIGERIAIHASKRFDTVLANASARFGYEVEFGGPVNRPRPVATVPLGAVVATAVLKGGYGIAGIDAYNCWRSTASVPGSAPLATSQCRIDDYGDYFGGMWVWWLDEVVKLGAFHPMKGRQGLFHMDRSDEMAVAMLTPPNFAREEQ